MTGPKITVVIPTRERCEVLEKSLRTVTDQDYDNLDILLSDNHSSDATRDVVSSFGDARIRYLDTGRRLSMADNWEFALSHVSAGWVTIIGDDDGLLPGSVSKVAALVPEFNVSAIRSSVCSYAWPSLSVDGLGRLSVPLRTGYEVRSSRRWLAKLLAGRATYPELPMLYNGGYVATPVLDQIRKASGRVYRSSAPDVYSAVAICSVTPAYAFVREPLAINGASRHSTGTSQFAQPSMAEASPAQLFALEDNLPFHPALPLRRDGSYPSSLQAIAYEAYLQSTKLRSAPAEPTEAMHAQQLRVILAQPAQHPESVSEWGRDFAAQHGLDFASISARARRDRKLQRWRHVSRRLSEVINTYELASESLLTDVHQASGVAADTLAGGVSRIHNVRPLFDRVANKLAAAR